MERFDLIEVIPWKDLTVYYLETNTNIDTILYGKQHFEIMIRFD